MTRHTGFSDSRRQGITLLEIIFSIIVLAGSMLVLSNLSRMGMRNAVMSRDLTQAQLLCETILAEIEIGVLDLEPVYDEPVMDFPDSGASNVYDSNEALWLYSVELNTIHENGLLEVIVTVTKNDSSSKPLSYRLVRWMIDKETLEEVLAERESISAETSTGTSGTGGGQ
ncbi:MAG: hypothetical protein LBQ54_07420 [Planctomycetaceae bacterium]|jgi:Tfp pilus assembly protein PilV|nr:hypothetical protein [Planctomycetaceae bacterium]